MNQEEFFISEKYQILMHAETMQRNELANRREDERRVFTWSNTILLALIGMLLIVRQSEDVIWSSFGFQGKILVSLAIAVIVIFSITWQNRHQHYYKQNARVLVRIEKILHYYDEGFFSNEMTALLPNEWARWGQENTSPIRILSTLGGRATFILGVLTIIVVWLT